MPDSDSTNSSHAMHYPEVNYVKAIAIVAVVFIHCIRSVWSQGVTELEVWLANLTAFAVPAFIAASGFLYATCEPVPAATTLRRLRRVLLPYIVASAAAQLSRANTETLPDVGSVVREFLFAASFGHYYYVFVIFVFVLACPIFARVPRSQHGVLAVLLFAGTIVSHGLIERGEGNGLSVVMFIRNPLLFAGYFFLGWVVRIAYEDVTAWVVAHRRTAAAWFAFAVAACVVLGTIDVPHDAAMRAQVLYNFAVLALIFTLTCRRRAEPASISLLGGMTYGIYLFHFFFLLPVQRLLPPTPGAFDLLPILAPFAAGLAGAVALIFIGRRVLGRYSLDVLGA